MKILFYIPTLIGGGAERVTAIISSELARRGHLVYIATNTNVGCYEVDSKVNIFSLYSSNPAIKMPILRSLPIFVRAYIAYRTIKPDIVIGVMPIFYLLARIITLGSSTPVIASDHTSFRPNKLMRFRFIRFHLYKYANAVTILTNVDANLLGSKLPNKIVMPNPLSYPILRNKIVDRKNTILAVGRLDVWYIKGFDVLIKVWGRLAPQFPDWRLQIAGTGNENSLNELKNMTVQNGVSNSVDFLGFQKQIDVIMRNSSIFVLSSRIEGFPMGLVEAMSQGCACLSFAIGGAIREIIENRKNGIIVADGHDNDMTNELSILMNNKENREYLSQNALKDIESFDAENIGRKWEVLFYNLLSK